MKFPDTLYALVLVLAFDLAYLAQSRTDCTASVVKNALLTRGARARGAVCACCVCVREIKAERQRRRRHYGKSEPPMEKV